MSYTANSEKTFQALQVEREKSVQKLRTALTRGGVKEFVTPSPLSAQGVVGQSLLSQAQVRAYDIESVIRNATEIRAALADFEASIRPPPTVGD